IKITSCYLEHSNYEIHSNTIAFASYYQQFSNKVKELYFKRSKYANAAFLT
ncbi:1771_t:CDS:1, partial [Gigaspora margarita]